MFDRFEVVFAMQTGRTFTQATEGLWKTRALGERDMGVPPFKMPTLHKGMLWAKESMRNGYHPKMLLYALDELFYIYSQIKNSQRADDKPCWPTRYCASLPTTAQTGEMGSKRPVFPMPWPY